MLEGDRLRSNQNGDERDKRLIGGRGHHGSTGARVAPNSTVCALAAALLLLFGGGGVAAQDALPTVSVSDAEAYEDGYPVNFAVSLSQPSSEEVTVEFATSSGTATKGTDFRGGSLTLTFPPNRKDPRRVSVRLIDDLATEPDETFTVKLTNPVGATLGDATATGTIRNDDTAATLTASDIEDTTATLTISGHTDGWWYRRDEWLGNVHPCTAVTAGTTAVSIVGLTAAKRYEYTAFSDSTCATRLARVTFWTLAPEGTPTVNISDAEASEDGTWMHFRVSLSQASREPVTVDVHTSSGTATSGTDFSANSETLTFAANSRGRAFSVIVRDDQEPEPDETFTVTLTNPTNATLGDATATGTIKDDGDTAATLTSSDIEDTTATLTIGGHTDRWWYRGRSSGTSSPWGVCTAVTAGTAAVGITSLKAMTTYEYGAYSDSGCSTKLANVKFGTLAPVGTPTVSISDAEASEDGKWIRFEVSLSQPSREEVWVRYETLSGTATSGTDFQGKSGLRAGSVIFDANRPQITRHARVKVFDDQKPEPDETFTVRLISARGATLGDATATGTIKDDDTGVTLAASNIEDTTATLTISDHSESWWYRGRSSGTSSPWGGCTAVSAGTTAASLSGLTALTTYEYRAFSDSACSTKLARLEFRTIAPEGTPTVSVSDAQVSEDNSWIRFNVSLSQPSREPVTVWFETSSGTATSGTDFDARPGHLSFSANSLETTGHASVIVHDDEETEPDETFTLRLTRASNATLGGATTATGTIKDNDTGATLAASNIEDTTATLTIADHTDGWWYKGNAHSCMAVAAGTTAVGIDGLTAVTDYEYSAYSDSGCSTKLARVAFRTLATEGVTPTVSVSDAEVSEDGGRMLFWVSLSQPIREPVTVDVQTSDGTAASGTDYRAESQTLTFPANSREPELVPVLVHDDQTPEPDETFTLTLSNPTGATLGDATATGTIRNDDTAETGVAVVSGPGDDATYGLGDTIRVAVTFGEAVTVDTTGGTPSLAIDMDPAEWGEKRAAYESGIGTDTLIFVHEVVEPNLSTQGIAVLADRGAGRTALARRGGRLCAGAQGARVLGPHGVRRGLGAGRGEPRRGTGRVEPGAGGAGRVAHVRVAPEAAMAEPPVPAAGDLVPAADGARQDPADRRETEPGDREHPASSDPGLPIAKEGRGSPATAPAADVESGVPSAERSASSEAVAWAMAHLSEREAVFSRADLLAAALAYAPGTLTVEAIEREVAGLEQAGTLHAVHLPGARDSLATDRTVGEERETVALMQAGGERGQAPMRRSAVQAQLHKGALTAGQREAVQLILSAKDRVVGVQGYAGTGKTTMLDRARTLAEKKGWRMAGLAPSASAVKTLAAEARIESQTLQGFLARNAGVAAGRLTKRGAREMRAAFAKTILVVDEGSLTSTVQARDLLRIAAELRIPRVVLVGDAKQLDAVDAGKPFAQLQAAGMQTAVMDEIMRQRDPALKEAVGRAAR